MKTISVRAGLMSAFAGISALVVIASGTGLAVLSSIGEQQARVNEETVPAVVLAKGLVIDAAELRRIQAALAETSDPAAALAATGNLRQVGSSTLAHVDSLDRLDGDGGSSALAREAVTGLTAHLEQFAAASAERIGLQGARAERYARVFGQIHDITGLTDTLVANARATVSNVLSTLYDAVEDPEQLNKVFDTLDKVVEVDLFRSEQMSNLKIDSLRLSRGLVTVMAATTPEELGRERKAIDGILVDLGRGIAAIPDPARREQAQTIFANVKAAVVSEKDGLLDLTGRLIDTAAVLSDLSGRLADAEARLSQVVVGIEAEKTRSIETARGAMAKTASFARIAMIGLSIIAIVVSLAIGFLYVHRGILRRLATLNHATRRLSEGDSTVEVPPASDDELGMMAAALGVFKANAQDKERLEAERRDAAARAGRERAAEMARIAGEFERSVLGIVELVSSQAADMQRTAKGLKERADGAGARTRTVATASEQASASVQTVASSAEELTASIREITGQVLTSARASDAAVREAQQVREEVSKLSAASSRIGEVVGLINGLAAQTNLLALNATIEAARAGEAGKGFAVVASEVKSLAKQSASATDEIADQIARIQEQVTRSVTSIESIVRTIENLNATTTTISASVEQQQAATNEISRGVQLAASGASEVNSVIREVADDVAETGSASGDVLGVSERLVKQSEDMKREVRRFLESIRAA